jgi:uncharacterized protein
MGAELRAEFRGHFENLAAGRVTFPVCEDCGRQHWYPMPLCPHCRSSRLSWRPVRVGEIWSWTVVRRAFDPNYHDRLPYVVAMVSFEDAPGIRLVANVEGVAPEHLRVGLPVEFVPPAIGDPLPRPVFRPVGA